MENPAFLKEQIITYLGNKRALLDFIGEGVKIVKSELKKEQLSCVDLFSGSGVVARYLKQHAKHLIANDLELYSNVINNCYLANYDEFSGVDFARECERLNAKILANLSDTGFIRRLYSPRDDKNIAPNDRAFYTNENAAFIDTARALLESHPLKKYFLAGLLYEASVHVNTGGVFKGFYKNKAGVGQFGGEGRNALARITGKIRLKPPVFSRFCVPYEITQMDANALAPMLSCDLCYIDPPYNQHPYSANYFMLNLIASNQEPTEISRISGIAKGWNKSLYNAKEQASKALFSLVESLNARAVLISYNNEGFISENEFCRELSRLGRLLCLEREYNCYRASRNLNKRSKYTHEKLYILFKYR